MTDHEPSTDEKCLRLARTLIICDKALNGEVLRRLEALQNPTNGELLGKLVLQHHEAWKEKHLPKSHNPIG